jgi:hypothetical protein
LGATGCRPRPLWSDPGGRQTGRIAAEIAVSWIPPCLTLAWHEANRTPGPPDGAAQRFVNRPKRDFRNAPTHTRVERLGSKKGHRFQGGGGENRCPRPRDAFGDNGSSFWPILPDHHPGL